MKSLILLLSLFIWTVAAQPYDSLKIKKLWHSYLREQLSSKEFLLASQSIKKSQLDVISKIRFRQMQRSILAIKSIPINVQRITFKQALVIASEIDFIVDSIQLSAKARKTVESARHYLGMVKENSNLTQEQLKSLLKYVPDLRDFYEGKYQDTVLLYMLCRKNRKYPCRFILKDMHGEFVKDADGKLWSLPALAKSRKNLAYNITNGQTPMGIHRMNSVMPIANRTGAFGQFRRVILNWVSGKDHEKVSKMILPSEHWSLGWWRQASVARDVGRFALRIHGTGTRNNDPKVSYYPHVPTSGCISTLEGKYGEHEYVHQRILLDKLMESLQLAPVYRNELNIYGLLYVLEIDNALSAVSHQDIQKLVKDL